MRVGLEGREGNVARVRVCFGQIVGGLILGWKESLVAREVPQEFDVERGD